MLAVDDSGKTQKINLEKRDSSSDLALLQITQPDSKLPALQTADNPSVTEWNSVAVFRFRDGVSGSSAEPELIVVPAKRDGTRIQLGELVDSSAFGSPIVAPEGVIGIVQDESSGVAWSEAARVLKLEKYEAKR
jgi:S1-C subfamily serine protease